MTGSHQVDGGSLVLRSCSHHTVGWGDHSALFLQQLQDGLDVSSHLGFKSAGQTEMKEDRPEMVHHCKEFEKISVPLMYIGSI